jgi:hypothetical protein
MQQSSQQCLSTMLVCLQMDGAGWDLLDMLLQGSSNCRDLMEAPFLAT